jgi:hypothetical protein
MSRTPEGWYPDPTGRHQLRWWTGRTWAAAVVDDGVQQFDPDFLTPGAPQWPRAEPSAEDHGAVLAACHSGAVPGDDPLTAGTLVLWHRRSGMVDLHPTWSVHDGAGSWLGTFVLAVSGTAPRDRSFVLHRADGGIVAVSPDPPHAVARLRDGAGQVLASIVTEGAGVQRLAAEVDGMTVAHATYSVGEVAVTDAVGNGVGRLVPPPLKVRRQVGRRVGWDPVLVSEQTAVGDPVTGRGVNVLALAWEHTLREWVA